MIHDHRKVTLHIEHGVREALAIRHNSGGAQVLFAGNSLVFEDLSLASLQQSMGDGFLIHTAGVPGSTYSDWRYGLRALYRRGSQPDVLVFGISPSQFLRTPAVTPVILSQLWNTREIAAYNREHRLNLTLLSELLLEHYSTFFSLRDIVRIYVRKQIPGYEAMQNSWSKAAPAPNAEDESKIEARFSEQLSNLLQECGSHTRLVLMIAPTNQPIDEAMEPALKSAAQKLGILVIEPVGEKQWPLARFQEDGYHLTPDAAEKFSDLVGADLKQALNESDMQSANR